MDWETYLDRLVSKVLIDAETQAHARYELLAEADVDIPPWDEFRRLFLERLLLANGLLWPMLQENLVTMAEIARRYQMERGRATRWAKRDDWPDPKIVIAQSETRLQGGLYWWPDIEKFRSRPGPRRGRPPKLAEDGG